MHKLYARPVNETICGKLQVPQLMLEALKRQPCLLILIAWMLPCAALAASHGAQEDLRAAKLVENAVMTRIGDRHDNPTETDCADMKKLATIYQELVARYPENADVRNAFASFLWSTGRHSTAITQWEAAEGIEPKNAETAYRLGDCHLTLGTVKKAIGYFSRASELAPGNALYHLNLGTALFLFRKEVPGSQESVTARALEELRKAAKLEPLNADYAKAYAETFYGLQSPDWQEAFEAWTHYLEVTSNKNFAYSNLARVSLKLGRKKEARDFLAHIEGPDFEHIKGVLYKQARDE